MGEEEIDVVLVEEGERVSDDRLRLRDIVVRNARTGTSDESMGLVKLNSDVQYNVLLQITTRLQRVRSRDHFSSARLVT